MSISQSLALFFAAMLAGMLNSVAGGGSLISFPALLFAGVPSIEANATNTVALWPGLVASVSAYRRELATQRYAVLLGGISLVGGVLGAFLLLNTPERTFDQLVPYLLLLATLLFTFGNTLNARLRRRADPAERAASPGSLVGIALLQLLLAIYGGYFGAGLGIMILAVLAIIGMEDIHAMNALKTLFASLVNSVAVVVFIIAGVVVWPKALLMAGGAILGGYAGAAVARRLDRQLVRRFVVLVGFGMTIIFFARQYLL